MFTSRVFSQALPSCARILSRATYHTIRPVKQWPITSRASSWPMVSSFHANRLVSSNAEVLGQVNEEVESLNHTKTFCVVHIGGRQFKVTANDLIVVNRLKAELGADIFLEKVLLAGCQNVTFVGQPILSKDVVRVRATVVEHNKSAKVIVFKKKRRKNYKKKLGHRQPVTVLRINNIQLNTL